MKKAFSILTFLFCSMQLTAQTKTVTTYPVAISFASIGTGVPSEKPLAKFINDYKKECRVKKLSAVEIGPFGREGEYKIAFPLTGLSTEQRTCFIDKLTEVAASMRDRGMATVERDFTISDDTMPPRATIKPKTF